MPFIDNNFKITAPIQSKRILMTTADQSPIYQETEKLARFLQHQEQRILCVDGDLGNGVAENPYLNQVLQDKGAITKAIKKIKQLSILGGKSELSLAQQPQWFQQQLLSDLQFYEENFSRIIVAIGSQNIQLQKLWLSWADKTFLFFQNENIFLEKTAEFISKYKEKINGLIGVDSNPHETRLAWMRLKKIIPETPDLIVDITKIAL